MYFSTNNVKIVNKALHLKLLMALKYSSLEGIQRFYMSNRGDFLELVKHAQLGDEASLNRLSELSRERLRSYVYRLTLRHDVTQDIVQDSLMEMVKVLGKLKKADSFWPWLYGIALNKIRRHHRKENRRRTVSMSNPGNMEGQDVKDNELENVITQELKELVSSAMRGLKSSHRAILTMRCYDKMAYSEIAKLMKCSEIGARMLFYRAKKSLAKQLARSGLGRGSLLGALVLFGKMTAGDKASAAAVSVTASSTKVGVAAGLAGIVSSKAILVPVTAASILAVGTVATTPKPQETIARPGLLVESSAVVSEVSPLSEGDSQCWYYYPSDTSGPVMMRMLRSDGKSGASYCQWRQNDRGNYYFDKARNKIYIENYRMWNEDLSVRRLPTDSVKIREFLSRVENNSEPMEYIRGGGAGMLVIVKRGHQVSQLPEVTYHHNVLDEEYFRYNLPVGAEVIDRRDEMHRRGWTYFRINGRLRSQELSGVGRIPFVYAASKQHYPWLRLKRVSGGRIVDVSDAKGFAGLGRPWMGLHTIDTVRRDAAEQGIWFETKHISGTDKAQVVLKTDQGQLIYTIDMKKDVIEKIVFSGGRMEGELIFSYLETVEGLGREFVESGKGQRHKSSGVLWLVQLPEKVVGE